VIYNLIQRFSESGHAMIIARS